MNSKVARHVVRMLDCTSRQKFLPDEGATAAEVIAAQLIAKALEGDVGASVAIVAIERDYDPVVASSYEEDRS